VITPLDCQDLVELITDYLEGVLPASDQREFEEHLVECDGCTDYVAQMRTTIELTGRLRTDDIDPVAVDRLLEAFRENRHDGEPTS
jgi:anti-sigma factor RsiW